MSIPQVLSDLRSQEDASDYRRTSMGKLSRIVHTYPHFRTQDSLKCVRYLLCDSIISYRCHRHTENSQVPAEQLSGHPCQRLPVNLSAAPKYLVSILAPGFWFLVFLGYYGNSEPIRTDSLTQMPVHSRKFSFCPLNSGARSALACLDLIFNVLITICIGKAAPLHHHSLSLFWTDWKPLWICTSGPLPVRLP